MRHRRPRRLFLVPVIALLAALTLTASALASADHRTVKILDDCEQASFNAAVGPGTCVGDGKTTFDDFVRQIQATGSAKRWAFSRDDFELDARGDLTVENRGGEFHTFTEVANFGGGCIPFLNELFDPPLTAVPECAAEAAPGVPLAFVTTGVPPGGTLEVTDLTPGTHLFECLIHPWMRTTAVVRNEDD